MPKSTDAITGTPGDDRLVSQGNGTADLVLARTGNDTIIAGSGDTVDAGPGTDTIILSREEGALGNAIVQAQGGPGDDSISSTFYANAVAFGGPGNDNIIFDTGRFADGGPGNDHIRGAEVANGGPGNDIIDTTLFFPSQATFTGGPGHDIFNVQTDEGPHNPYSDGGLITDFSARDELHYSGLDGEQLQISTYDDYTLIATQGPYWQTSGVRLEGHFDRSAFVVTDTGNGSATITYEPNHAHAAASDYFF